MSHHSPFIESLFSGAFALDNPWSGQVSSALLFGVLEYLFINKTFHRATLQSSWSHTKCPESYWGAPGHVEMRGDGRSIFFGGVFTSMVVASRKHVHSTLTWTPGTLEGLEVSLGPMARDWWFFDGSLAVSIHITHSSNFEVCLHLKYLMAFFGLKPL